MSEPSSASASVANDEESLQQQQQQQQQLSSNLENTNLDEDKSNAFLDQGINIYKRCR